MKWNSRKQLEALVCELVGWDSRTGTEGEIAFPANINNKLLELDYFQNHPDRIQFHDAGNRRNVVSALYMRENIQKTVVLISHFDTVHTAGFGVFEDLAFSPREVTTKFKQMIDQLPEKVQTDVASDDYLFGRGVMDMKMGLALHLHILEIAIQENWNLNLMLITVPDEEVNSAGMRTAVSGLVELRGRYNLEYALFLNSEPTFAEHPTDEQYHIYSGTIGKIMPSALFYGIETHAGEPLNGINAHFMASFLTKKMEYNKAFSEERYGERTPLPLTLKTIDLKWEYSTQTSNRVAAFYNVFLMEQNASDVMDTFQDIAAAAMEDCAQVYESVCKRENMEPLGHMCVIRYEELLAYATDKLGTDMIEELKKDVYTQRGLDEREMSAAVCDTLMRHCQELAPATVLFFAPPYYPSVNSSGNKRIKEKISLAQSLFREKFNLHVKHIHYFNGISDLSYVNYDAGDSSWQAYQANTPVWGDVYSIPFEKMQSLQAPVINIGPYGKDAHKSTERLHKESAFVQTPYVLRKILRGMSIDENTV